MRGIKVAFMAAVMLLFCSCSGFARDIDNVDLCRTLGIERSGGGVRVYALGEELRVVEAATVADAITVLGTSEQRPVFFSHVERIILDPDAWDGGAGLDFIEHNPDLRFGTNLFFTDDLESLFEIEELADFLETAERLYGVQSVTYPTAAGEALAGIDSDALVPTVRLIENKPVVEGFLYLELGEITAVLDREEAIGANIIKNRLKSASITVGGSTYKIKKAKVKGGFSQDKSAGGEIEVKVTAEVAQAAEGGDAYLLSEELEGYINRAQGAMNDLRSLKLVTELE